MWKGRVADGDCKILFTGSVYINTKRRYVSKAVASVESQPKSCIFFRRGKNKPPMSRAPSLPWSARYVRIIHTILSNALSVCVPRYASVKRSS